MRDPDNTSTRLGVWACDAFVKKNSGRGFKRAPYLILDRRCNSGVTDRYELLCSRRSAEWERRIVGVGSKAYPGNGIRMFLRPAKKAVMSSTLYWADGPLGHSSIEPLNLIIPILWQMYGPRCGFQQGVKMTMSALRDMVASYFPEMGGPSDVTAVITGHTSLAERGVVMDTNAKPYQEQLAMHLESQVKIGLIMSESNQTKGGTLRLTNWTDPVPPLLLRAVQRTIPSRIKVCELDCRLIAQALIDDIEAGNENDEPTVNDESTVVAIAVPASPHSLYAPAPRAPLGEIEQP